MDGERSWQADLCRYVEVVDRLEASVHGLSEASLDLSLSPQSWTIRQIVHHVVDGDDLWKVNIKAALGQPKSVLSIQWYWDVPQDRWVKTWAYADRALSPSLGMLGASRNHVVQILNQVSGSSARKATFCWPDGRQAELTVCELVVMQTNHVIYHIRDIQAIREAYGV